MKRKRQWCLGAACLGALAVFSSLASAAPMSHNVPESCTSLLAVLGCGLLWWQLNRSPRAAWLAIMTLAVALSSPAAARAGLLGTSTSNDTLYEIGTSPVSTTAIGGGGTLSEFITGLAYDENSGVLYGVDTLADQLVSIDASNGTWTTIGTDPLLGTVSDLAFDPNTNTLYSATSASDQLVRIDTSTAAVTSIGPLVTISDFRGMAFDPNSNTLYATDANAGFSSLYTINTTTGAATLVGGLTWFAGGLAFDRDSDTLYGVDFHSLLTIDTTTGLATEIGTFNPFMRGLTFAPVPEPSTLLMAATCMLLPLVRRRIHVRATGTRALSRSPRASAAP